MFISCTFSYDIKSLSHAILFISSMIIFFTSLIVHKNAEISVFFTSSQLLP